MLYIGGLAIAYQKPINLDLPNTGEVQVQASVISLVYMAKFRCSIETF